MEPFETFIWKRIFVQLGGVIAISAILGGFILTYNAAYNSVVNLDQQADERWAGIAQDMQGRYGEIPGLLSSLGNSPGSDALGVGEVARNMSALETAMKEGDIGKISTATTNFEASLSYLSAALKGRPDVAASPEVEDFLSTLNGTEERLSVDQLMYNEAIQAYNLEISSFPASLWAYNWGYGRREYFTARIGGLEPPSVPAD